MTLPEYIEKVGDHEFGRMFNVSHRTAQSYRLRVRYPRPALGTRIVDQTKGRKGSVTFEGIYRV